MENLTISPMAGFLPTSHSIKGIIAPPYDVISREEAKAFIQNKPFNMLRVTRADALFPEGCYPYQDAVYQRARVELEASLCTYAWEPFEGYLIYQIAQRGWMQTGVLANCANSEKFIRTHEKTRDEKRLDRVRLQSSLNYQISPLLLMHAHSPDLDVLLSQLTVCSPDREGLTPDGSYHRIWRVPLASARRLAYTLRAVDVLYMADGHHRLAASRALPGSNTILGAMFSEQALRVLPYHRVLRLSQSPEAILSTLERRYRIERVSSYAEPQTPDEVSLYLAGNWYALKEIDAKYFEPIDRVPSFRAEHAIIAPLLGTRHAVNHPDLDFVGGFEAPEIIQARVDVGRDTVGVCLAPIEVGLIKLISDRGDIMPPKSTWFEPKLADGLILCR